MTIENLAVIVQKGFKELRDEMVAGFAKVDKRFDHLESDVAYLKSRVEEIGRTLARHEEILEEHSEILDEYSKELKSIREKLEEFTDPKNKKRFVTYQEFTELEARVAAFEKKIGVPK